MAGKPIGGAFALEKPGQGPLPHAGAQWLSTGRACLAVFLREAKPSRVFVPFYACNTLYQPFVDRGVPVALYGLGEDFLPSNPPALKAGEYLLWTNYFGVCGRAEAALAARYGERLIVDDTHAFFAGRHAGMWSFASARKFFGIPDGAFLFAPVPAAVAAPRFDPGPLRYAELRARGRAREAERAYAVYERRLDAAVRRISRTGEEILRGIDYVRAAQRRRANFAHLHARLGSTNRLAPELEADAAPFCYPYLPRRPVRRAALLKKNIFVPRLWTDALVRAVDGFAWERLLGRDLMALPIDQRYGADDMERVCEAVS
jgi:hypothetical protein